MTAQVALLRAVNVGGRKLIMSELRTALTNAGFEDVRTLLTSGNVLLNAKQSGAKLERELEKIISDQFGMKSEVFVRNQAELDAILAENPYKAFTKTTPNFMVVYFMRASASAAEVAALEASRARETFKQGKDSLYITFPDGQGRSKLKLPKLGTARNWNSVTKLAALVAEMGA